MSIAADLIVDFEAGTIGDLMSAATLNSGTHGAANGNWTVAYSAINHTYVNGSNKERRNSFLINGVTYTGAGTRSIRFDLTGAPAFEGFKWTPSGTIQDITVSGLIYFGAVGASNFDHIHIASSSFVTLQQSAGGAGGTAGSVHIETQVSGATYKSAPIPIDIGWYEYHLRSQPTTGRVDLVILDVATGALIGTSGADNSSIYGHDLNWIFLQDYLTPLAGETIHDSIIFAWGANATLPLGGCTVPAPTLVNACQIASGTIRLLYRGLGLTYLIERSVTGSGSWSTLATMSANVAGSSLLEYQDSTAADGASYNYRITAVVGENSSPPITTSGIIVRNTPPGTESTYQTQSSGSSSVYTTPDHTLSQRIKNTLGVTLWISEVTLYNEFFERANPEVIYLTQNPDGTGIIYGVSNAANITADGPIVFTFHQAVAIPTSGCYLYYAPLWARTQIIFASSDVYFAGEGYNGSYDGTGAIFGSTGDLKFIIKQRDPQLPRLRIHA